MVPGSKDLLPPASRPGLCVRLSQAPTVLSASVLTLPCLEHSSLTSYYLWTQTRSFHSSAQTLQSKSKLWFQPLGIHFSLADPNLWLLIPSCDCLALLSLDRDLPVVSSVEHSRHSFSCFRPLHSLFLVTWNSLPRREPPLLHFHELITQMSVTSHPHPISHTHLT